MKLIYNTKKFIFETPEELQDKMVEYLEYVKECNQDKTIKYCKMCGTQFPEKVRTCCDNQDVEFKYVPTLPQDYIRPSIFGFASFCGMGKTSIYKYKDRGEGFQEVIEWFRNILQMDLEQLLLNPYNRNIGGVKFVAVNNFGWKDKMDVEHTGAQPVTFVNDLPDKSSDKDWQK